MKDVLEIKNISKKYQAKNGEIEALDNISFNVKEGEFVSIIRTKSVVESPLFYQLLLGLRVKLMEKFL